MSDISVNVTNAGAANVSVSGGSTVNATVGNGGTVSVGIGSISPGNATVVSGTLTINSTTTLAAGSNATVTNKGTAYAAVLDFGIPTGAAGPQGPAGQNGINGVTPSFAIGTVTTGAAGSNAAVTATTSNNGANVTLNLTIPRGDTGASGANGTSGSNLTLSDSTPSALGTAAAGSSNLAARADHVHALPTIAYANLSGVPSNFPTNTTLVSGLAAGYSAIGHAHNYVTGLNNLTGNLALAAGSNVSISANGSTLTISAAGGGIGANDAVNGGVYVGQALAISYLLQPQSQTINLPQTVTFGNASSYTSDVSAYLGSAVSHGGAIWAQSYTNPYIGVIASTDNGATWARQTQITSGGSLTRRHADLTIASNGSRSVVCTGLDLALYYSDDNLATVTAISNASVYGIVDAYGYNGSAQAVLNISGRFIAVKPSIESPAPGYPGQTGAILASTDGVSWSSAAAFDDGAIRGSYQINGNAVVVGQSKVATSADGQGWTVSPINGTSPARVVSDGSRLVGSSGGNTVSVSANGVSWAQFSLPINLGTPPGLDYAHGLFFAYAKADAANDDPAINAVATSPDGQTWTVRTHGQNMYTTVGVAAANSAMLFLGWRQNETRTRLLGTVSTTVGSANLTVAASVQTGAAVSYQWQRSVDGYSWANVSNATSNAIAISGLTAGDNGTLYRAIASAVGVQGVPSNSAMLTVIG